MLGRNPAGKGHVRIVIFLAVIVLAAYFNSLGNRFVWDDASSVQRNPYVQNTAYLPKLFVTDQHIAGRGQGNFYRPLVSTSFMLDFHLWGRKPFGYHLTNTLLHLAVVLCLYAFYVRFWTRELAAAAAALYAVMPVHTEAVAYISGRADMMVAMFGLAALVALGRAGTARRPVVWPAVSSSMLIGAFLSKELAVAFPFLILAADLITDLSPRGKARGAYHAVSFGLMTFYLILRATVFNFADSAGVDPAPFIDRIGMCCQTVAKYAGMILWPFGLHMERSLGDIRTPLVLAGAVIIVLWGVAIIWSRKKNDTPLTLGLGWTVIAVIPFSGLFPLNAAIAEHWLYVPAMGVTLAAVALAARLAAYLHRSSDPCAVRRTVIVVSAVIAAAMCIVTARQNTRWYDNETLFEYTLQHAPESARVHYNLGVVYELQGRPAEAAQQFMETIKRDPENLSARLDLAGLARRAGDVNLATKLYKEAVTMHPADPEAIEAYVNLGVIMYNNGNTKEAKKLWDDAMKLAGMNRKLREFVQNAVRGTTSGRAGTAP